MKTEREFRLNMSYYNHIGQTERNIIGILFEEHNNIIL